MKSTDGMESDGVAATDSKRGTAFKGGTSCKGSTAPAQNSLAGGAKQPTGGPWRTRTAWLAPWIVQLLWLCPLVSAIAWLRASDLGWSGIVYVIAVAYALLAWLAWSIVWTVLTRQSVVGRVTFLVASGAALLFTGDWMFAWRDGQERQILDFSGRITAGLAIVLLLAAWRGWRIGLTPHCTRSEPSIARRGQFSIGDLLLLTAATAAFLGLMSARENFSLREHWEEIVAECLLIASGLVIPLMGLGLQRSLSVLIVCPLIAVAILLAAIAILDRRMLQTMFGNPAEILLLGVSFGPGLIGLLVSIGLARWWGYRLTPGGAGL